ncbi:MAG: hypothetical protein E6R11_01790 [Rhodocyclaceae bacterium]|nr:MAG: hypothetical protein E6R11_01790 [Rhodocyclaceae bacterium]
MTDIDSQAMRALGARLLTQELIVYPVRHHSPGCAWQLRRLIDERAPSVVLVEGPRSFTSLIPLLTHVEARMPLAVYTYAVRKAGAGQQDDGADEWRRAAYYPFCDYSPELVALRAAAERGIPARFIDLEFCEQCLIEDAAAVAEQAGDEDHDADDGDDARQEDVQIMPAADADRAQSLLDERHYRRSRHLQALAEQLGCRDHEELWEHLFEATAQERDPAAYLTDVATYCMLARSDCSARELGADGTLQREAEMAWHLRQALAEREPGQGPVLAVVGGFHAVVLPDLVAGEHKRPAISRTTIDDEASALIRYSFDRLDRLNGYSAGMTSPAWHQSLWEGLLKAGRLAAGNAARVRREAGLIALFDIAETLRKRHGLALPVPALSAAYEQMLRLAQLRGRSMPIRDDVLDAITSCFIKGDADADGLLVRQIAQQYFGGYAMGRVPPGAGTPPLVRDFEYRARLQRLKLDDSQPRRAVLEIYRRPAHRITSRLFHGLVLLGVPFAMRTAGPDFVAGIGLDRLQEHWEYAHSAATEAALVEASMYGVTVPLAVANRFSTRLDALRANGQASDARAAAAMLSQACVLGLHDHLPRVIGVLREAIAADAAFDSLAAAAGAIGLLWESREPLEARDVDELPMVLQAAYERAIYLGGELRGVQGDGATAIDALSRLRELLVSEAGHDLDAALYWAMVGLLQQTHPLAALRGACAGLRYRSGLLDEGALGAMLQGHLDGMLDPRDAVGFLRGLLQTARESAWQQPAILETLDGLLQRWDEAVFVASLPELRLAFANMTPKETDRIAEAVAQRHGLASLGRLIDYEFDEADLQSHLSVSQALRDVLRGDGLEAWGAG